jgi:hypothetical protein
MGLSESAKCRKMWTGGGILLPYTLSVAIVGWAYIIDLRPCMARADRYYEGLN